MKTTLGTSIYSWSLALVDREAPFAPTALTASAIAETTLTLDWTAATDNVGVTNYKVYQDAVEIASLGNVLTYDVTGLTASTSYDFIVTALDLKANESIASNTETVITSAAPSSSIDNSGTIIDSGMVISSANAFDGDLGNRYLTSAAQNGWVGRDYGVAKTVDRVRLLPFQNATDGARANGCQIEYSTDGTTYTSIYTVAGVDGVNYINWIDVDAASFAGGVAITAQYWRIRNNNPVTYGGNLAEIEFYTLP